MLNRAQTNVLLLALCQALASTAMTILLTVASLVGYALATNKALATLPITVLQVATMMATIPASLLMKRLGRQRGLMMGSVLGLVGAGVGIQAIVIEHFPLFCLATFCLGAFNGFAWYYRFAAQMPPPTPFDPRPFLWWSPAALSPP